MRPLVFFAIVCSALAQQIPGTFIDQANSSRATGRGRTELYVLSGRLCARNASGEVCTVGEGRIQAKTATYPTVLSDFVERTTIAVSSGTFTITLVDVATQPLNGQRITIINYGSGTVTVARSGQTINGAAADLTIGAGSSSAPNGMEIVSDGANYVAQPLGGTGGGGGSSTNGTAGQVLTSDGNGGFGTPLAPSLTINGTSCAIAGSCAVSTFNSIVPDATTSRTLSSTDCGTTLKFTNSSAITLTVPGTLPAGCGVQVIQAGTGNVTPVGSGGLTATNDQGLVKSRAQNSVFVVIVVDSTLAIFQGSLQ